jgi:hypothetical protein
MIERKLILTARPRAAALDHQPLAGANEARAARLFAWAKEQSRAR